MRHAFNILPALLLTAVSVGLAYAAPDHSSHGAASQNSKPADREKMWQEILAKPSFAVTADFDEKGRLWLAAIRDKHVYVSHSDDNGVTQSAPIKVNAEPESILGDGENRPKIIVRKDVIYISYTQGLEKPMTGHIRFSRSADGGKTFSAPITVNDNLEIISHRFDSLAVNGKGQVYLAWLDKREQGIAEAKGEKYNGSALYYAMSDDGGVSFQPNAKAADHVCECCRTAMTMDTDDQAVVIWRHIFDNNIRDHALVKLDGKMAPVRLSNENWSIAACPHHGPSISIAQDGVYHAAWFSNAPDMRGLFYSHSADQGKSFSKPLSFGNLKAQPARPYVLSLGKRVYIVWKEFDGESTSVNLIQSADGGRLWSEPKKMASTADTSDHPMLVANGEKAYLSWNTMKEGYRLIALPEKTQ